MGRDSACSCAGPGSTTWPEGPGLARGPSHCAPARPRSLRCWPRLLCRAFGDMSWNEARTKSELL